MDKRLRVLHIEDSTQDAALLARHLLRAGYEVTCERVETPESMRAALETRSWDLVLCDYSMPQFDALAALALMKQMNLDLPFIIISGTIGEAAAVQAMRAGAHDYLIKDSLARLIPAIEREIGEAENRRARRAAEQQLALQSAALDAAANSIVITDTTGRILWVNPSFTQTSGYSFDEAVGKTPRIVRSGVQDQAFYEDMWTTILAGNVWRRTIVNRRKDGSFVEEDLTITPIRDKAGVITHFIGIRQDITELKRAEEALRSKNAELAAMTQQLWQVSKLATMGELAASIAHELNNPLTTVTLGVEALLSQVAGDESKTDTLTTVRNESERMADLISNLLQFSRRSHAQISTLNLATEMSRSLDLFSYHLISHNVRVIRETSDHLPTVQADRQQMLQVFLNVLTNASDAMPEGGILTVRVHSGSFEEARPAVVIEFIDTGV
ncbi:MAG TPA: PAS domain S-box protein, partial [Pyrinomonadaceae bacterium]|nr:PAS domain S-box protein [Pyrinomonadaceae bacterium]